MTRVDVLIVGAGPTGLALALWATRQGLGVRIIDKTTAPGSTSRAMAVHARTLELYRQLGIADEVAAAGHKNPAANFWVQGQRRAQLAFGDAGAKLTPYPFLLVYPQDRHEHLLVAKLLDLGVTVERETEFLDFEEKHGYVTANLRRPGGETETCEALYIAGCDGAHSPIRHQIGSDFPGGTYEKIFYVADAQIEGRLADGQTHIALESADFMAFMAYDDHGGGRLIGTLKDPDGALLDKLTFDDVGKSVIERLGLQVTSVKWFSTYRVHHRVTDRYRRGRAFLLGDAAHIHSPVGGQGMNTGIGDAINLAWKLAAVIRGQADESLLDSYEPERQGFAHQLIATTDKIFTFVTAEGEFARFMRTRIAPVLASLAFRLRPVREAAFRTVSQCRISYRLCQLNEGLAGRVSGGERLPWVRAGGEDNYASLAAIAWQVHVYGAARPELTDWCQAHGVALHVFPWKAAHGDAGLARDALYLLRPDSYIALAELSGEPRAIDAYAARHGLRFT